MHNELPRPSLLEQIPLTIAPEERLLDRHLKNWSVRPHMPIWTDGGYQFIFPDRTVHLQTIWHWDDGQSRGLSSIQAIQGTRGWDFSEQLYEALNG